MIRPSKMAGCTSSNRGSLVSTDEGEGGSALSMHSPTISILLGVQ